MDNAAFDRLSNDEKTECLLGIASGIFGQNRIHKLHDRLAPVVRDCSGHGEIPEDPRDNYWGGVWQIYRAE
jgi:hypothetical protein